MKSAFVTKKSNMENTVYICEVCGHLHDEETMGRLEDLPKFANCPDCGSDAREVYKLAEF